MDSAKYPKTDHAVMLLNEIEILLAQTRLMELYLKQSEAIADNETARVHEQYQTELVALRSAAAEKERILARDLNAGRETEKNLRDQIHDLENRFREKQHLLETRDAELNNAQSTISQLTVRIAELESACRRAQTTDQEAAMFRQGLQAELLALRHQLENTQNDFQSQQLITRQLQENLETRLAQLRDQLTEKQTQSQSTASELEQAKYEIARLRQQLSDLQTSSHEHQRIAGQELEQARARFELELGNLQTALAVRDENLRESENAYGEIERNLKTEIVALRSQLEQRQELIEFRDDELRDVHGHLAALQQRVVELESSHDASRAGAAEIDALRRSFESEIAALEEQVAFKERTLSQRQEAATAVELALNGKIQTLQEELARSRNSIAQGERKLDDARAEAASLRQQLGELEAAAARADISERQLEEKKNRGVELETELARLHATLAQKEYSLKEQEGLSRSAEERLGGEIGQLREQLAQRQIEADSTGAELARLRAETAALHEQKAQSEGTRRQLDEDWQQAAAQRQELENRLLAKDEELRAAQERQEAALKEQDRFRSAEDQLGAEIKALRAGLDERQTLADQAIAEIERLHSEIAELREQNSRSELAHRQFEENRQHTDAAHQELTARLRAKEHDLSGAQETVNELKSECGELQLQLAERGLLAQSRVMEIGNLKAEIQSLSEQLGQRESIADQAAADLYRETESSRAAHQAELAALREEHSAKQQVFENDLGLEKQKVAELRNRIEDIERRAGEAETALSTREHDFLAASSEAAALRTQVLELDSLIQSKTAEARNEADQARMQSEAELAALRHDAQQKAWALAQQQANMENLALAQRNQVQKLEARLAEQQNSISERNLEIERAQSQTRSLQRRIEELESELQYAQLGGFAQAEQISQQSAAQIDDLNKQLAQKSAEIQDRAMAQSALEQSLRDEINQLIQEASDRNRILQDRNDEVVRVKAEMDLLLDRLSQLESSASQSEATLNGDLERTRTEFQAQLALLQAELSQKEWALEEQRAVNNGKEQQLRQEVEAIRQQLAQVEPRAKIPNDEFVIGDDKPVEERSERQKRYQETFDSIIAKSDPSFPASESRRWRGGFGWKRRWKSS